MPAGSAIFDAGIGDEGRSWRRSAGTNDVLVLPRTPSATPATEPIDRKPRILVLTGALNQDVWSLRNLGFTPDFMSTAALNSAADDPLPNYDVIWNTGGYPAAANATGRARLQSFFAAGGGYIGAGANGASFLNAGGLVTGLTAATRSGNGRSGIVNWLNSGGATSPITGASPSADTAIMDPPTWFTRGPGLDERRRPASRRTATTSSRPACGCRTRSRHPRPARR